MNWRDLSPLTRVYVVLVIAGGASALVALFPRTLPDPLLLVTLIAASCITSSWKVPLPISLASGSTLSVSYAADLMALLIAGPGPAILVAIAGAWTQCRFNIRHSYAWYRAAFSMAAEALTMALTAYVYVLLGGSIGQIDVATISKPLLGAIGTYFIVNTGLIATAIALSVRQSIWKVWRDDFLWSAPAFVVAGAVGAGAAVMVDRGWEWAAALMLAPVYLAYRTYRVFLSRLEDQKRHLEETTHLHEEAVEALSKAHRAEQELAAEKERLAVTFQSVADGIVTLTLDGTIQSINRAAEILTGWKAHEAVGNPLSLVFKNFDPETRESCDNSVEALMERRKSSGAGSCTILVARDLAERPIEESIGALCDAEGRAIGIVLTFRDITDALRIQEERAKAGRLASLGVLAGGMAHDFNNVLMAILGNVSLARATISANGEAANALSEAEQACVRARQLTWQLMTFAKGGVPVKTTVAIARVLRESASLVLRGSNATCTFDLPPDLWDVQADEGQMVQVFSNVLLNAQQAMLHGGTIVVSAENVFERDARVESALKISPGPHVRVSIADKGIGIAPEHINRIFDPYFTTKQRGSGLGLATAYSIVKHHGGVVSVDSALGRGTSIHVTLPAFLAHPLPDSELMLLSQGGAQRVLVMDDESSVRRLTVSMLEFLGYDGEVVESGTAAVERFTRALQAGKPFDVVMLDLIVPGEMGGKEAMSRLASLDPSVKGILISGYAQDTLISDFRDYGFTAAISKPFTLQELRNTLDAVATAPTTGRVH